MNTCYQALSVIVKYLPATNFRPSRIKISCPHLEKSKVVSYQYDNTSSLREVEQRLFNAGIPCLNFVCGEKNDILVIDWEYRDSLINFFAAK